MSRQPKANPLPQIVALARAVREPGQPEVTFRALDRAMSATIGHKLFTVLLYHADRAQTERFYSSDPTHYPIGGRKDVRPTAWTEQLLIGQRPYIGRNAEDIRTWFLDHALIHDLGCDAILNVPVVYDGVTLGTANLMHVEGWYDERDIPLALTLASYAVPAYLRIAGRLKG